MNTILLLIHVGLCAGIFYACFCRLVKMSSATTLELRASVYFQSLASSSLLMAPFAWGMEPSFWMCVLLSTTLYHFFVMKKVWIPGVPHVYITDIGIVEEIDESSGKANIIEFVEVDSHIYMPSSPYHSKEFLKQLR